MRLFYGLTAKNSSRLPVTSLIINAEVSVSGGTEMAPRKPNIVKDDPLYIKLSASVCASIEWMSCDHSAHVASCERPSGDLTQTHRHTTYSFTNTHRHTNYRVGQKKRGHRLTAIILSILNRFKKFFH